MRKLVLFVLCSLFLAVPANALELEPPRVPDQSAALMPEDTDSFSESLTRLLRNAVSQALPDLSGALTTATIVLCAGLLLSVLQPFSGSAKRLSGVASAVFSATILLQSTGALIRLGASAVADLSEYGKLFLPVMTAALAAQGHAAASAALYAGTAAFDMLLTQLIAKVLVPLTYLFILLAAANSALEQQVLKKLRDLIRWIICWTLKTLLTVYTAYISITGVVSGTTDAAALKAAKLTISTAVPVVGSILSDASEAVLVSAGLMKNAAGIYGILAFLSIFLLPFLRIGIHYAVLKGTAALSCLFCEKGMSELLEDFSSAMGFLLAMTAATCLLLLISTICFMKGAG